MRTSPGAKAGMTTLSGATVGNALGEDRVTVDGDGNGDREGVLPDTGEKVAMGLATATGDELTSMEGVGAVEVGARPHAERTTTSPIIVAKATRPPRLSNPNLSGPESRRICAKPRVSPHNLRRGREGSRSVGPQGTSPIGRTCRHRLGRTNGRRVHLGHADGRFNSDVGST